jgi:hypothetical protein
MRASIFRFRGYLLSGIILLLLPLSACHHPFDPRGPLDNKMVVFSILSNDRNLQYVRVEHTYMPIGFDALSYTADNFVPNAFVTIRSAGSTFLLRDTVVARPDSSRYMFPIRAYYARPLAITYGASYQVSVASSQLGSTVTSIVVPEKPSLSIFPSSIAVLESPLSHAGEDEIIFTVNLGNGSRGWIGRLYLYYDVLDGGGWREERTPIPIYSIFPKVFSSVVYAEMSVAGYKNRSACVYLDTLYRKVIANIAYARYPNSKITFTRVVFELVQVDEGLYNYYEVAHAGGDPLSVRLDEPLYTNLTGGVGVVGVYTLDSLVHVLPDNFISNRR